MSPNGRERADALILSYSRWDGFTTPRLGLSDDVTFGPYGFHYDDAEATLVGRVFVEFAWSSGAEDAAKANGRKVFRALEAPTIGAMFDHGGGQFMLDEGQGALFLVKPFAPADATEYSLRGAMDHLRDVAATWRLHWLYRVARIAHDWDPPPTHFTHWTP